MGKLSIDDLVKIKERTQHEASLRQGAGRARITVHMGTCGIAAGAREIMAAVLAELERAGLHDVLVTNSGCAGLCSQEPMMTVETAGEVAPVKYVVMTPARVKAVVESHIVGGRPVKEFALAVGSEKTR
jgi:NADP-reducing hydrogenase subunit HndB